MLSIAPFLFPGSPVAVAAALLSLLPPSPPIDFAAYGATANRYPDTMAVGLIDSDDCPDYVVLESYPPRLRVFIGDGAGRFTLRGAPIETIDRPADVALGDFNSDGIADIAVAAWDERSVSLYFGGGLGYFESPFTFPLDEYPIQLALGDFDRDGALDAIATTGSAGRLALLRGDGAGRLGAPDWTENAGTVTDVAAADLDLDGHLDLVLAASSADDVTIWLGNALGRFERAAAARLSGSAHSLGVADFDEDGFPDVVAGQSGSEGLTVLFGDGAGGVRDSRTFASTVGAKVEDALDADADGNADVLVRYASPVRLTVLYGDGTGNLESGPFVTPGGDAFTAAAKDVDSDGLADWLVLDRNAVVTILGDGARTFATPPPSFPAVATPAGGVADDLDGDGRVEWIMVNGWDRGVSVYRSDGTGTLSLAGTTATETGTHRPVTADFDGDGNIDVAVSQAYALSGSVFVHFGDGRGGFDRVAVIATGYSPRGVVPADFDGDGDTDLAIGWDSNPSITVYRNDGRGGFALAAAPDSGESGGSLAAGDFDGDGNADLAVVDAGVGADDGALRFLDGDGRMGFAAPRFVPVAGQPIFAVAGDLDSDGADEVVCALYSGAAVAVVASSAPAILTFATASSPSSVALADFDRDGTPDLAVAHVESSCISVLRGIGRLAFGPSRSFASDRDVRLPVAGDLNDDGFPDIVALSGSLVVFANLEGDCGAGTVNSARGAVANVLFVNDSAGGRKRQIVAPARSPIEVRLAAAPAGPESATYALWAWTGATWRTANAPWLGSSAGCSVLPTPLVAAAAPQAIMGLAAPDVDGAFVAGLRRLSFSPASSPFVLRRARGFPRGTTFTLQAAVMDAGSAHPLGMSLSNAVTLIVR